MADARPHRHLSLGVETMPLVIRLEQFRGRAGSLRVAQPENPRRVEGVMQQRQDLFLQDRLEVDQQVAATDQIHPREWWVGDDVLSREDAHVAERLANAVTSIRLRKEAAQSLRRDVLGDVLRVEAGARAL